MNEMEKRQGNGGSSSHSSHQNNCPSPSFDCAKGLLAIIFGVIALAIAHKIIIAVMFLFAGLVLIHYGMQALHIRIFTRSIDEIWRRLKTVFKD